MIAIDFYGLPGCGKSTIANKIYEKLKKDYSVELFNDNDYSTEGIRKKNIVKDYCRLLLPHNLSFLINVIWKMNIKKNKKNILKQSYKEILWKKLRLALLYDKLVYEKNKKDIILVDQGIIQDLSDYIMYNETKISKLKEYLNKYNVSQNTFLFVNCETTIEESITRIQDRNRKKFAFDSLNNEELRLFLKEQKEKIDLIDNELQEFNKLKKIRIRTKTEYLEENVDKIIKEVVGSN